MDVFISYARRDDVDFKFLKPLQDSLGAFFSATTGREITFFTDRQLAWGDDWRSGLDASLGRSLTFIPVVSANYLTSESCRAEFLSTYARNQALGTKGLILPLLLVKTPLLSENSQDDIVQKLLELQYRDASEALLEGADSSTWQKLMNQLAKELSSRLDSAETQLAGREEELLSATPAAFATASSSAPAGDAPSGVILEADGEDAAGVIDLIHEMEGAIEHLMTHQQSMVMGIQQLGKAASEAGEPPHGGSKDMMTWAIRIADKMKEPSVRIQESGKHIMIDVTQISDALSGLARIDLEMEGAFNIREQIGDISAQLDGLHEVDSQISELVSSFRHAEALSASLRKNLKPARRGLVFLRDALALMEGWSEMLRRST